MNQKGYYVTGETPLKKRSSVWQFLKMLGMMLILAVVITTFIPRNEIDVDVGEDELTVRCISGNLFSGDVIFSASIRYEAIATIDCVENTIRGSFVSGYAGRWGLGSRCDAGIWNEPAYGGNYDLLIREEISDAIHIETETGHHIVFNFESSESTKSLYQALLNYLEQ